MRLSSPCFPSYNAWEAFDASSGPLDVATGPLPPIRNFAVTLIAEFNTVGSRLALPELVSIRAT